MATEQTTSVDEDGNLRKSSPRVKDYSVKLLFPKSRKNFNTLNKHCFFLFV